MKRLKEMREGLGLTQQAVADQVGLERASYVRYEQGSRNPPLDKLIKLANFYCVSLDYLVERTDKSLFPEDDVKGPELGENFGTFTKAQAYSITSNINNILKKLDGIEHLLKNPENELKIEKGRISDDS